MPFQRPSRKPDASSPTPGHGSDEPDRRRRPWVLPLAALILGLVLGGGGVGLLMQGRQAPPATSAPSPTATSTPSADVTPVNVPRACLRIADEAKVLQAQLDEAVKAARDLNASQLSDLVRQIDEQQNALQTHAQVCRQGVETPVPITPGTGTPGTSAPDESATSASPSDPPTPASTGAQKRAATARPAPAATAAQAGP